MIIIIIIIILIDFVLVKIRPIAYNETHENQLR